MDTVKSSRTEPIIAQVKWILDVEELFKKCTKAGDRMESDHFEAGGVEFFLRLNPHGQPLSDGTQASFFVNCTCSPASAVKAKVILSVNEGPAAAFSPKILTYDLHELIEAGPGLGDRKFISSASLKKARKVQFEMTFNAVQRVLQTKAMS